MRFHILDGLVTSLVFYFCSVVSFASCEGSLTSNN